MKNVKFRLFPEITDIENVQAGHTNISSRPIYNNMHFRQKYPNSKITSKLFI